MKLNTKVWLIVVIVIVVIVLVSLGVVYFQQVREQQRLNDQLDAATDSLTRLNLERTGAGGLEDQLAQAESLLYISQAKFPQAVESIEYGEYIFEIADRCNLGIDSLTFPKPAQKTEGAVTYSVVSLQIPVRGTLADIFEFIDIINTDPRFASTQVKSVNLNVEEGSATISVDIYAYKR